MHEPLRCWLTTARSSAALACTALLGENSMGAVTLGLSQALHKRIRVRFHRPLHSSNSGANEMLEAGLAKAQSNCSIRVDNSVQEVEAAKLGQNNKRR